jgi:pantoate--beta-alanine ligase
MIADLHLELELVVAPTVRDADGLAVSSRNVRLSPEERGRALALPRALATGDPEMAQAILEAAGLDIEYVAEAPFEPPTLAAAVRVGSTRLIDNVPFEPHKEES